MYAKEDFHFARTPYKGAKKVAIITGGNSGLGYESARRLLLEGMQVVLACRNEERGKAAVEKLLGSTTNRPAPSDEDCVYMGLNLSDLKSVEAFSQNFIASKRPLHVLMCNAGVMAPPEYQETTDGIEMQFQANFLSHFLLCNLYVDSLDVSFSSPAAPNKIPIDLSQQLFNYKAVTCSHCLKALSHHSREQYCSSILHYEDSTGRRWLHKGA